MDIYSKEKRSQVMSSVRARDTKPEMVVRTTLHAMGYRYRLHRADLPGSPDIVLPKHGAVIFVHGCFWHNHEGCAKGRLPASNREFWEAKIHQNVDRDHANIAELQAMGWRVLVIWECQVQDEGLGARLDDWVRDRR